MAMTNNWRAVVRAAIAPLLAEPRASAVQVSQRLAGHVVEAMETQGDWVHVRGADGYTGWVHAGYLGQAPGETARQSSGIRRVSLGCVTRAAGGEGMRALPLGALLAPDEVVESGRAVSEPEMSARFPRTASAVARSAQEFFSGASYQWGGITPWGADCSGFVQTVCWLHGVSLPRDAWEQAQAGEPGRTALTALQAGELAFFSDREDLKVTHVGLGIGAGRMAHVAIGRGGFAVERLSDGRDGYVRGLRERFQCVRVVV